jgi:hypothetical protein
MEAARFLKSKNPHSNLELPLLLGWPHPLNTRMAVPRRGVYALPRPAACHAGRDRDIAGCGKNPVATSFIDPLMNVC